MQIRLRNILMERGITVKTIADALGVDVTSIPVYDRFAPSIDSMKRMADWLQVPTWELFCDCGRSSWTAYQRIVTEPLMERFARRLKELAREQHLQLNVVAERAGMSKANLSLSMKRNITTTTIEKIARALEIEDKAYLLFITPTEYDAIYHAAAPSGVDHNDPSVVQTVTEPRVESPGTVTENMPLGEQLRVGGQMEDLFAQIQEPQVVVMQEGVTYVCGTTRITIVNGKVVIG